MLIGFTRSGAGNRGILTKAIPFAVSGPLKGRPDSAALLYCFAGDESIFTKGRERQRFFRFFVAHGAGRNKGPDYCGIKARTAGHKNLPISCIFDMISA